MEILRIPDSERPRERLLDRGAQLLGTAELIALVLNTGQSGTSALHIAHNLLSLLGQDAAEPLTHLRDISPVELMHLPGIGPAKAATLLASIELGRRIFLARPNHRSVVDTPEVVAQVLGSELTFARQEQFAVLLLDIKNRLIAQRIVSVGTIDETIAHPREVFREAIRQGAAGIIVAHNHPSGQTDPSCEDLRLTEQLLACGKTLQIPVLDHVILGSGGFTSLRRTTSLWQTASR